MDGLKMKVRVVQSSRMVLCAPIGHDQRTATGARRRCSPSIEGREGDRRDSVCTAYVTIALAFPLCTEAVEEYQPDPIAVSGTVHSPYKNPSLQVQRLDENLAC